MFINRFSWPQSWVTGTMVAHSSSVQVIACSNLTKFPPLHMHCEEVTSCALATNRLVHVAPEMDLRECTLHSPPQKRMNKAEPTLAFKNLRRHHQKSKTGVPVALKKDMHIAKSGIYEKRLANDRRTKERY